MTWNYRVIKSTDEGGDDYAIHEVYYDGEIPTKWSTEAATVHDYERKGLNDVIGMFIMALAKPTLRIDGGKLVEVEE